MSGVQSAQNMRNYSQKMVEHYHKVAIAVVALQKLFELGMSNI